MSVSNHINKNNKKPLPKEQIYATIEAQRIANGYFNFGRENKELIKKYINGVDVELLLVK